MKDTRKIAADVEAAINSLEGIQRAELTYFFESRLISKLEARKREKRSTLNWLPVKPAFVISMLTVFVVLNVFTIASVLQKQNHTATLTELETLAQDYNLGTNTLYNTNTTR